MKDPTPLFCAKVVSPYSSIWDAVDFWEGDLVNYFNHSTIYRGPPTLEREIAWNDLWHRPGIPIDRNGIAALNKSNIVNPTEIIGSDPNHPTYAAQVEVFHQLHCLNHVRRATWPLTYFNKSWGMLYPWEMEEPVAARMHTDHCLETLRLSLMCYADITPVLLLDDIDPGGVGTADFNVHHKCRDFEKIVDYVEEHGVEIPWPGMRHRETDMP
ncbi:hypothetical protein K4F52_000648 [Lecanicillium sp. MT-2017a]|nr:hypothetical protein K4F52_000648 [Lecanicillium sp. MT-2017a]